MRGGDQHTGHECLLSNELCHKKRIKSMKELRIDAELNLYKESASLAETPRTLRCLVCFLKKQILPSVIFVRDHGFRRGQALSCLIADRHALRPFDELRAGNFRVQSAMSIPTRKSDTLAETRRTLSSFCVLFNNKNPPFFSMSSATLATLRERA